MSRRSVPRCVLALAILGLFRPTSPEIVAQESVTARPTLGGHTFIWNPTTRTPFPRTFIRSATGVGRTLSKVIVPSFEIGNIVVQEVRGNLLFADLDFHYQHRVQDWLGVWVRFNLAGRLGTTTGALLAEGINTLTGFELGWLFRLVETRSVMLSGTANLWSDGSTDVDILRWAKDLGKENGAGLVESSPTVRGGGGLRFAWGINEGWGLLLTGEGGFGESSVPGGGNGWVSDLTGGVSFDMLAYTDLPLGFVLTGASRGFDREEGRPDTRANEVGLRTALTGRDNFLIALDTRWTHYNEREGEDVGVVRFALALQFYF